MSNNECSLVLAKRTWGVSIELDTITAKYGKHNFEQGFIDWIMGDVYKLLIMIAADKTIFQDLVSKIYCSESKDTIAAIKITIHLNIMFSKSPHQSC